MRRWDYCVADQSQASSSSGDHVCPKYEDNAVDGCERISVRTTRLLRHLENSVMVFPQGEQQDGGIIYCRLAAAQWEKQKVDTRVQGWETSDLQTVQSISMKVSSLVNIVNVTRCSAFIELLHKLYHFSEPWAACSSVSAWIRSRETEETHSFQAQSVRLGQEATRKHPSTGGVAAAQGSIAQVHGKRRYLEWWMIFSIYLSIYLHPCNELRACYALK